MPTAAAVAAAAATAKIQAMDAVATNAVALGVYRSWEYSKKLQNDCQSTIGRSSVIFSN